MLHEQCYMKNVCFHCGKGILMGRQHTHHRGVAGGRWKKRAPKTAKAFAPNLQKVKVMVGDVVGKIKVLKDYRGVSIEVAPPGTPARILGLKGTPQVGDILQVTHDKKAMRDKVKQTPKTKGQRSSVDLGALKP